MIALALSGGGAKGDFEVGAVRCLTDRGVVPSLVCSTSVGSVNALKVAEGPSGIDGLEAAWLALLGNGDMYSREAWTTDPDLEPTIMSMTGALVAGAPSSPTLAPIVSLASLESAIDFAVNNTVTGSSLDIAVADQLRLQGFLPIAGQVVGLMLGGLVDKVKHVYDTETAFFNLNPMLQRAQAQVNPAAIASWAAAGNRLRMAVVGLASGRLRYVTETGAIVERDGFSAAMSTAAVNTPITTTLLTGMRASSSIPAIFPAVPIADDVYVDGGIRMVLPTEVALRLGATTVYGIQAAVRDLDRAVKSKPWTLLDIAMRSLMDLTINEVAFRDSATAVSGWGTNPTLVIIQPRVDTHDSFTIYPAFVRNRMMYGYLCAADVVAPGADPQTCEWTADEITLLRHAASRLEAWHEGRPIPPSMISIGRASGPGRAQLRNDILTLKTLIRDRISVRMQKGGLLPPQNHTWTDHREWWQNWEHHPLRQEPAPIVNARVCALSPSANRLDVFVISSQNNILHASWRPDTREEWEGWYQVQDGQSPSGAVMAATSRHPGSIDVIVTGTDGTIFSAQWDQSFADTAGWPGWHGFSPVASAKTALGGGVAIVSRRAEFLDAFTTGTDGTIWAAAADPGSPSWKGWWKIGSLKTTPGARLGAVSRALDNLDLFVADSTGAIQWSHWDPTLAAGWTAWSGLLNGKIKPGQAITAVSRAAGLIDLFVVGTDGKVYTAAFDPAKGWAGWWPIGSVIAPPGSEVAAVVTKSNSLDIFVVDTGGNIQKSHWQPGLAAWTTWLALPFGHTTPGTALSVVSRAPGLMDLFFVAADGYVWSAAFDPAIGTWQGPWRLHVDLPDEPAGTDRGERNDRLTAGCAG